MMKRVMNRAIEMAKKMEGDWQARMKMALTHSWKVEKGQVEVKANNEIVGFKDWFVNKNFDQNEAYAIRNEAYRFEITKETEKAYRFTIHTEYGKIFTWAPKSVCMTEEDERQEAIKAMNAWENGLKRNKELRQKAIELGVKCVGPNSRLKTATLERKIKEHLENIA